MELVVADDEASIRAILSKHAAGFGYTVLPAKDAQQALAMLMDDTRPRMAILDWMMPDMTGLEICTFLRKAKLRIQPYLIILTARSRPEDVEQALEAGADDFIAKPYSLIELRARLGVGKRYLQAAEEVEVLSGLLPICTSCKKIRDDSHYWHTLEEYFASHSELRFSHSLCPDCLRKEYPELAERVIRTLIEKGEYTPDSH